MSDMAMKFLEYLGRMAGAQTDDARREIVIDAVIDGWAKVTAPYRRAIKEGIRRADEMDMVPLPAMAEKIPWSRFDDDMLISARIVGRALVSHGTARYPALLIEHPDRGFGAPGLWAVFWDPERDGFRQMIVKAAS